MNNQQAPSLIRVYVMHAVAAIAISALVPGTNAQEAESLTALQDRINQHESEYFSQEQQARMLEKNGLVPVWDRLNEASETNRFDVLIESGIESITLGKESARKDHGFGISETSYTDGGLQLDTGKWSELVQSYRSMGYGIVHSDFHQERFEIDEDGNFISDTRFTIQGSREEGADRLEIKATARVKWRKDADRYLPANIEILTAKIRKRSGSLAFEKRMQMSFGTFDYNGTCNVHDLNGDQYPEILIPSHNRILWNRSGEKWDAGTLIKGEKVNAGIVLGLIADLTGDGIVDLLVDRPVDGKKAVFIHAGLPEMTPDAVFSEEAIPVAPETLSLTFPSVVTAGDIDKDGDIDLYVTQYRDAYEKMPSDFWDANDGFGNFLLLNDGKGGFTDATESAGLAPKQFRRTFSSSFVDLDADGDLDLMVVSDYCGTDLYHNDGTGKFVDVTDSDLDMRHTFGMSHAIADYDLDGKLDMFVTGMSSTTSRRLERMGAFPAGYDDINKMRSVMGYGNRMYLAKSDGGFAEPGFKDSVASTGWSWGSVAFDFDNDGDQDIYVGNGHLTGKTTEDYCSSFWCRDIYLMPGQKRELTKQIGLYNSDGISWDGYQCNSLLVNQGGGNGFQSLGFMLDVGFDFDARQVVATDLDLDGCVDLLISRAPDKRPRAIPGDSNDSFLLMGFFNIIEEAASRDWIGVTLTGKAGVSTLGAVIELETEKGTRCATIVAGDSFLCQHPAQKHFGIEPGNAVKSITVRWPDGSKTVKNAPALKQYHALAPGTEG